MKAYKLPGTPHLYGVRDGLGQSALPYLFWHQNGGETLDNLPVLWSQNKLGVILLPAAYRAEDFPASVLASIAAYILHPPVAGQLSFIVAVDEQGRQGGNGYVYVNAATTGGQPSSIVVNEPFQSFGFKLDIISSAKITFSDDRILFEQNEATIQSLGSGLDAQLPVQAAVTVPLTGPQAGRLVLAVNEILASTAPTDHIGVLFHYQHTEGEKEAAYLPFAFFASASSPPSDVSLILEAHPFGNSKHSAATHIAIESAADFATAFTQSNGAPVRVRVPAPAADVQPPRFVIQQQPSDTDDSTKSYFAPQGDFQLLDNGGADWQILLSQTGSQYLRIPGSAEARLRFVAGNASFVPTVFDAAKAPAFDTALEPAHRLGTAKPALKPGSTSWVQVVASQPLRYVNEAEKHLFYEPAARGLAAAEALADAPAATLVAVETGALPLGQPLVFPLLPLAGMAPGLASGWGPKLEELMVSPARHAFIATQPAALRVTALVAADPDPLCYFRVTPQGFVIVYAELEGREHYYFLLFSASVEGHTLHAGQPLLQLRKEIEQFVFIREPDEDYIKSLLRDQLMLVTSAKRHSLGRELQTKLRIRILDEEYVFDWFDKVAEAGYFLQKYHDQPLNQLLEQTGLWSNYASYRTGVKELKEGVDDYLARVQQKPAVKELLHDILNAPHWRGMLVMDTPVQLPSVIKELMRGVPVSLTCLAFEGSQVLSDIRQLEVRKPSFTALISYENPDDFEPSPPEQLADYQVSELFILFRNAEIVDFRCTIKLKIKHLFAEALADPEQLIVLRGTYSNGPDGERYVFAADTSYQLDFPATSLLQKIQLNRIEYTGSKSGDKQQFQFTIDGKLYFNSGNLPDLPIDLLSIQEIDFSNLALCWFKDGLANIKLDMPQLSFNFDSARLRDTANSLLSAFPLKFKQFHFSTIPLSVGSLGFQCFGIGDLPNVDFQFGFSFELNLGVLGGLAAGLKDLKAAVFLGWQPGQGTYQMAYGIRFPDFEGKDLQIGIESFIRITLRELTLRFEAGQLFFHSPDVRVDLLGQSYPKSTDSRIGALIFRPKKTGSRTPKTAWLIGYTKSNAEEKEDIFIGAGQRFLESSQLTKLATTDAAVGAMEKLLGSLKPDTAMPPEGMPATVTAAILQQYNEKLDWLFALRLKGVFSVLDVSLALYDPELYGLFLHLPTMGNLSVDIMYKKLGPGVGEWSTDLTLPDSLRNWDFGAVAITVPSLFVAIYTNGGFRVDVGFPRGLDYSRSFVVQAGPFIGWGGFYFAMTRGGVPNTFCEQSYPAVAVGFALRVGLGRQFNRGMLKAGLSVSVFGVLEGAANFAPGQSVLKPHELYLSGVVGIIAEVYGYVDFGIIKASIHILVEVSTGFRLQTNQATLLFIEAGVHVKIRLVIGSFKIFGKRFQISISLSFSTTLRFDWQLGTTTPCVPAGQALAAPAAPQRLQTLVAAQQKPLLELFFYFEYTQADGTLQALPMLSLAEKSVVNNADGRQYPLSFAALVGYLEDRIWQAAAAQVPGPAGAITYDNLREYEKTIAEQDYAQIFLGTAAETLFTYQFAGLAELRQDEVQAGVGYVASFFPMLPGVVLKSGLFSQDGGEIDYSRVQVSAGYKQALQQYFEQLFVHREASAAVDALAVAPPVALAQLMLEDYLEMLFKSVVDTHLARVEMAYQHAHSPDGPPAVQRFSSLPAAEQVKAYNDLNARINRFVRHGLQLPVDANFRLREPIFRYLKQQFPVGATPPEVALYYGGSRQLEVQPDYSPELSQVQLTEPLHSSVGPLLRWAHQDYTSGLTLAVLLRAAPNHKQGFIPVSAAVRSRLRQRLQPGQPRIPAPVFQLFRHHDQQVKSEVQVGYRPGTLLEFTVAPAASPGPGAADAGDFYALRGFTAERLLPLLDLLQAPATLREISLHYAAADELHAEYKLYTGSTAGIQLFKVNLSTESAPPIEDNGQRLLNTTDEAPEKYFAAASEPRAFLEILSASGIINQEGIFLQLPGLPATAAGRLSIALFVQSEPTAGSPADKPGALQPYHTHLHPAQELPDGMEYYWKTADWQQYIPVRPPAVVAFAVQRPAVVELPDSEPDKMKIARQTLENLYSLLDFTLQSQAAGQPDFQAIAGHNTLPVSPATKHEDEDTWHYEQGIRVPTPNGNRYERVGDVFRLAFGWRDVYGNPLAGLGFEGPPETLQYVDLLLGPNSWPGTVPAYTIPADNRVALTLSQGLQPEMWPANPTGQKAVANILSTYQQALEQQQGPGLTAIARVELRTSDGLPLAETRTELPAAPLLTTYLQGAIQALEDIRDGHFAQLTLAPVALRLTAAGTGTILVGFRAADERLAYLSNSPKLQVDGKDAAPGTYHLEQGVFVLDAKKMYQTYGQPKAEYVDVKLTLVSPWGLLLARQALTLPLGSTALSGLLNPAYLAVTIQTERAKKLVPAELHPDQLALTPSIVGADAVQQLLTEVLPGYAGATVSAKEASKPEHAFAEAVEQRLGGKTLRLGTGLDNAGQQRYWLIPRSWTDLRLTVKPTAPDYTVYAPRPVLNRLFSMTQKVDLPADSGSSLPATRASLDLDVLFRRVLLGLDRLLEHQQLPGLAAPLPAGPGPTALDELLAAKQAVARWYPTKRLASLYEGAPAAKLPEAQEGLRQQMLRKSEHAYLQDMVLSYRLQGPARMPSQPCRLQLEVQQQPVAPPADATDVSIAPLKVELAHDAPAPELLLKVNYTRNDFAPGSDPLISFQQTLVPTYLEHSIQKVDAPGAYEYSRWIKLHLADPAGARLDLRADKVQIVQRQYPALPAVSRHACLPEAALAGGTWPQLLQSTRRWRYQLELIGPSIGQDKGYVALYFGAQATFALQQAEAWNEAECIAAAAEVWTALEPRLQSPPDALTQALAVQFARYLRALETAPTVPEPAAGASQGLAGYRQTVHLAYRLVTKNGSVTGLYIQPAGDAAVLSGMADTTRKDSVELVYAAPDPQDATKSIEKRTSYSYLRTEAGEWLFGLDAGQPAVALTALRRVALLTPPLDLLDVTDAETGIYLTRNESLLQGKKIAKEYIYTTEEFRSARPLRPFVEHAAPLVYAQAGASRKPGCYALLHETFAALLETAGPLAAAPVVASCECYFLYKLPHQTDWLQATRRGIFLKESIAGSEPAMSTALAELSNELSGWAQEFRPVGEGALGLDITLSLNAGPLLLHLPYVVLPLSAFTFEPTAKPAALTAQASTPALPPDLLQDVVGRLDTIQQLLLAQTPLPDDLHDQAELTDNNQNLTGPLALPLASSQDQRLEQFIDGLQLAHFRGREFTPYWSRVHNGVQNSIPPEELWPNIVPTLVVLNALRQQLGASITLTSTYRSKAYNQAVGGEPNSFHQRFQAIDFTCAAGSPCSWAAALRQYRNTLFTNPHTGETFRFQGGIGTYRRQNFVHLDTRGSQANWYGKGDSPCPTT